MRHTDSQENYSMLIDEVDVAIRRKLPMTLTYLRDADYCVKQEYDNRVTVRTVEPYAVEVTKQGHGLIRVLDRDTHKPRSIREDRIVAWTLHRRGKRLEDHREENDGEGGSEAQAEW